MTIKASISSASEPDLMLTSMTASERLGELFNIDVEFESADTGIDLTGMLSTSMTLELAIDNGATRYFNGMVCEAEQTGVEKIKDLKYARYRVKLVPKPWLLGSVIDCRIFKDMSSVDIVKAVLQEVGYSDVESHLASYPKREYCVQYREDGLAFINRLMQQEGIYYFFKHTDSTHTMVLADGVGAHSPAPGFSSVPYLRAGDGGSTGSKASITEWASLRGIDGVKISLTDYNPLTPKASLLAKSSSDGHGADGNDIYDYPGTHQVSDRGKHFAQMRAEALSASRSRYAGATYTCNVAIGALFTLQDYPRDELNQEYLITATAMMLSAPGYAAGKRGAAPTFRCRFEALESSLPWRTLQTAEKPVVVGLQTAVVTGTKNDDATDEDIVVDKYGRVQVNFHWNMPDKDKADNSCPVRVATMWAGKNWGSVSYPRVGQEVVVSFIEGDPDRPLIVGSVYNAVNMPPYTLPDNKTQSGVKSRSLLGESEQFNELRFEDKKGEEEFYLHAQKHMKEEVEEDHTVEIGHDEEINVHRAQVVNIGSRWAIPDGQGAFVSPETSEHAAQIEEAIALGRSIAKGEFSGSAVKLVNFGLSVEDVEDGSQVTNIFGVGGQANHIVSTAGQANIIVSPAGQATIISGGGQEILIIGGKQDLYVSGEQEEVIGGKRDHTVKEDDELTVHGEQKVTINKKKEEKIGETYLLDVKDEITLTCGQAKITMKKSGDIAIDCGPGNFTVNGMNVELKADTAFTAKGATTEVNGSGQTTIKAGGEVAVKGGIVQHN